jgi:hypothetical protein
LHKEQPLSDLLAIEFLRCWGRLIEAAQQFADTEFNFFDPSRLECESRPTVTYDRCLVVSDHPQ